MLRTLLLCLSAATLFATPSMAGFNLMCSGDTITADFPLSGAVGFSLLGATITVGDQTWTTDTSVKDAIQIVPHQAVRVDDRIYIDLADSNYERTVAKLRLFEVPGRDEAVIAGTLELADFGAYTITCDLG